MKRVLLSVLFIVLVLGNVAKASSLSDKDVRGFLSNMSKKSQEILNDSKLSSAKKEMEYKKFTEDIVDAKWVSRFILGAHWKEITSEQRANFQDLYKEYLLENYMPKLQDYNKDIVVLKVEKQRDKVFMAQTKTKDPNNKDINVNFRIIENEGKLYITDIIPEGISFIGSQRSDVDNAITQKGYDNFIKELKGKIRKK